MSYDPNAGMPPMGKMEQRPSSGKKWWMIGGCGCFTLLLLCCGGGIGGFYSFVQPVIQIMNATTAMVRDSGEVKDALGTPIELSAGPINQNQSSAAGGLPIIEYEYSIKGSKEEGVLVFKMEMKPDWSWERTDLYVELEDGTKINVDPEAELTPDLDIDDGDLE